MCPAAAFISGIFRAPARVTFYASGGPISSNSGRNGEKNAAKNPWFLDFLPPLPVCTESFKMLNRFASLRAAAFALKCAVAHFYILRCQRQRGSSHFHSTFQAAFTLPHPRACAPHSTTHGTRADLQTAGLNGVFAHFCRRGQKWVAPGREMALLRRQARKSIAAAWGAPPCKRAAGDADACAGARGRCEKGRAKPCPFGFRIGRPRCVQNPKRPLSSKSGSTLSGSAPGHILSQNSGASGVLRYSRGLPSASTSTHMPPELPEA